MKIISTLGSRQPTETSSYKVTYVLVECPRCGTHFEAQYRSIKSGHTKSCGCAKLDGSSRQTTKPLRDQQPRLYRIWKNMRTRCRNKNIKQASNYSLRGIDFAKEWDDFAVFFAWATSSGYRDDLSIDRIDVDKGYSPNNCRWATQQEQMCNTQLLRNTNTSGYRNVTKKGNRYVARATNYLLNERVYLGTYTTAEEAADAHDAYITQQNLLYPTNRRAIQKDKK